MHHFLKCLAMLLGMAFTLTGCVEIDQQVTFGKDELTYRSELKIDAAIMALSQKKDQSLCSSFRENSDEGIQFDVTESTVGGNTVCTVVAKGSPEKFANFSRGKKDKSELVKITKTGEKIYRIESEINLDSKDKLKEMKEVEEMMLAMFAGRNVTWAVAAPKIIETNGTLSPDKKSVSWSVPVADAFKTPQKFYAVVQSELSWYEAIIEFFAGILESLKGLFTSSPKPS